MLGCVFRCAKLSLSRLVNRCEGNFGRVYTVRLELLLEELFHFRLESGDRKLAFSHWNRLYFGIIFSSSQSNPSRVDWFTFRNKWNKWNWRKLPVFIGIRGSTYIRMWPNRFGMDFNWLDKKNAAKIKSVSWQTFKANFRFPGSDRKWIAQAIAQVQLYTPPKFHPNRFSRLGGDSFAHIKCNPSNLLLLQHRVGKSIQWRNNTFYQQSICKGGKLKKVLSMP